MIGSSLAAPLDRQMSPGRRASRGWPRELAVRPCDATYDADALWALFNQDGYRRSGTLLEPFESPAAVTAWLESHGPDSFQIVALMADALVAFAGLFPLRGRQAHIGWICVGVDDDVQGRGFGRSLLELIIASADRLTGLRRLQLYVFTDNAPAIALYRACGFEIEGRHARFARRGDTYVDAFTMARLITEA